MDASTMSTAALNLIRRSAGLGSTATDSHDRIYKHALLKRRTKNEERETSTTIPKGQLWKTDVPVSAGDILFSTVIGYSDGCPYVGVDEAD
jgi:hypothetical protein